MSSRTRYFALCVVVLLGAFAGGFVANRAIPVAHAQAGPENIRATELTLVNSQGEVQAILRNGAKGAELILNAPIGKGRIELSADGGVVVHDANGRITWSSPRRGGIFPAAE
jgi:hypothetical protein